MTGATHGRPRRGLERALSKSGKHGRDTCNGVSLRDDSMVELGFEISEHLKNSTVFTLPFHGKQSLTMGDSLFPAGPVSMLIRRAVGMNVLRTIQDNPTRFFPFPEIRHPALGIFNFLGSQIRFLFGNSALQEPPDNSCQS